jgi:FlaA1/EpsC-like NDP-sugar epimerase
MEIDTSRLSNWIPDVALRVRRPVVVAIHIFLVAISNVSGFLLRFDGDVPLGYARLASDMLPTLIVIRLLVLWRFRLFEGLWKYTSLWDLRNIVFAVVGSSALFLAVDWSINAGARYPRSIIFIDSILLICFMTGVRLTRRMYREFSRSSGRRRVLLYGAGDAGEMAVREMKQNPGFDAETVGFIDDDHRKVGQRIHGVKVLGTRNDLPTIIRQVKADEVLITIPSASPEVLRGIVRALEPCKARISILPRLADRVRDRIDVRQIRQLKVEDLLAREPVSLNNELVDAALSGKRVLVTGAGGSIGSELCRQLGALGLDELVMLDRYENALYYIHNELAGALPQLKLSPVIADVTDADRISQVFAQFKPQVVFHAAAHKHVPMMERHPSEAVKNNVRGTRIMAVTSSRYDVERFVLVSTDKAVNPTSVMGAAKRVAVRFGNVLASNGSVVPLFLSQIERGGPVTVTHPEMRRYFMLIREAVQLVLQAAAVGEDGSILVLDMGEQVRVADMARNLIRLAGYIPDKDIEITYTGVRPGEKLHEELVGPDENATPSIIPKIMKVNGRDSRLSARLNVSLPALEQAALQGHDDLVIEHLRAIVPTFTPQPKDAVAIDRIEETSAARSAL